MRRLFILGSLVFAATAACGSDSIDDDGAIDEQSTEVSSPRGTGKVYITGRLVAQGKYHTVLEFCGTANSCEWLSGGSGRGLLVGGQNWASDTPSKTVKLGEVTPPAGVTPAVYFAQLKSADAKYCDCAPYQLVPTTGYNSNSWVNTLIRVTKGKPSINMANHVGGDRVVPSEYFSD